MFISCGALCGCACLDEISPSKDNWTTDPLCPCLNDILSQCADPENRESADHHIILFLILNKRPLNRARLRRLEADPQIRGTYATMDLELGDKLQMPLRLIANLSKKPAERCSLSTRQASFTTAKDQSEGLAHLPTSSRPPKNKETTVANGYRQPHPETLEGVSQNDMTDSEEAANFRRLPVTFTKWSTANHNTTPVFSGRRFSPIPKNLTTTWPYPDYYRFFPPSPFDPDGDLDYLHDNLDSSETADPLEISIADEHTTFGDFGKLIQWPSVGIHGPCRLLKPGIDSTLCLDTTATRLSQRQRYRLTEQGKGNWL